MSSASPSKRGRKPKKSNKGRKPKKPLSREELEAKKNQKNMRETCRRVEINLHYELLYHSLGQNLVYNRAERVQLLRKAIIQIAELRAQVAALTDQVRATGLTPRAPPVFQLNDSQNLFMLVQRWARNDNGKKCSRAKLKPVGIEIIDDNEHVPITVPRDGRPVSEALVPEEMDDHIPFWASWETNTYLVVDQDAFEKACNQAIIAGWDGKLGSKGARYQPGLPPECGLTVASSAYNSNNSNHSPAQKYSKRRGRRQRTRDDMDEDDESDDDEDDDDDTNSMHGYARSMNGHHLKMDVVNTNNGDTLNGQRHLGDDAHTHPHHPHHQNQNAMNNLPPFPPRIDFPEIIVQDLSSLPTLGNTNSNARNMMHHSSSDSRSENNSSSTTEPPIKRQKLCHGRTGRKRKREESSIHEQAIYNNHNANANNNNPQQQFLQQLPLSVPFPAVLGAVNSNNGLHPMSNSSPFMHLQLNNASNLTPEHANQSSSDTGSQHSFINAHHPHARSNLNARLNHFKHIKSEHLINTEDEHTEHNDEPEHEHEREHEREHNTNGAAIQHPPQFQVQFPPNFLATFPPRPTTANAVSASRQLHFPPAPASAPSVSSHANLVPVATFPIYHHSESLFSSLNGSINHNNHESNQSLPDSTKDVHDTTNNAPLRLPHLPPISSISLPPISHHDGKHQHVNLHANHKEDAESVSTPRTHDNEPHHSTPKTNANQSKNHNIGDLSPSSHETRNSVLFTPANKTSASSVSTDSNCSEQRASSKSPRHEKRGIHLPDNTLSIDNFVNELHWSNDNNTSSSTQSNLEMQSDEYNIQCPDASYDIALLNDMQVSAFQETPNAANPDDSNGLKGSVFYG